jgi:hypothetical protein
MVRSTQNIEEFMKFRINIWPKHTLCIRILYKEWTCYGIQIPGVFRSEWGYWETWYDGPHYVYGFGPFCTFSSSPYSLKEWNEND